MNNLGALTKSNIGNWRNTLETLLLESKKLRKARNELSEAVAPFPPQLRDRILSLFEKLHAFDERVEKVAFPARFPEQRELEHLHSALVEMNALRQEAENLASKVTDSIDELDETLGNTTENYDLRRLSKVDLAILRLGAYEITKTDDIPNAVAINEAIELAKAFSGQDAASFVNGILDSIAKKS